MITGLRTTLLPLVASCFDDWRSIKETTSVPWHYFSCRGLSLKVQTIFLSAVSAAFDNAGRSSKVRAGFKDSLSLLITGRGHVTRSRKVSAVLCAGWAVWSSLRQVRRFCRCCSSADCMSAPSLLHRLQRQPRLNC